jgi:allophanate hydrolase subunit 2
MSKREDQRLAALAKKNAAKVASPKPDRAVQFDSTLRQRAQEEDPETKRLFKDMKKREF